MWEILLTSLILLSTILSCNGQCGLTRVKANAELTSRITFNGENAYAGQFPWLTPLFHTERGYLCGSSIITDWHLLTAAHCVISDADHYYALVGRFNLTDDNEVNWMRRNMSEVYVHSDFDRNETDTQRSDGDIAIFRVSKKIQFTDYIQPICLPQTTTSAINVEGTVAGYGKAEILADYQNTPSYAELRSINSWSCLKRGIKYANIIAERSFCAGSDFAVPCQGDSGSGFYYQNPKTDHYTIYGIVSFAIGLCDTEDYVAFVDVSKYIHWIYEKINIYSNPCTNINCGELAECEIINGKAECSCLRQFPGDFPHCGQRCTCNEDCADDKACFINVCKSLCFGSVFCVAHAKCHMKNHQPECECVAGYKGVGMIKCELDTSQKMNVTDDIPTVSADLISLRNNSNFKMINAESCGTTSLRESERVKRIVNGFDAKLLEFPWAALLGYGSPMDHEIRFNCGGNLISERFVLTAAHCVNDDLKIVRLGEHKMSTINDCDDNNNCADPVQDIQIIEKIQHQKFNRKIKINDIALLKLATPADTTKNNVKTICLPVDVENDLETIKSSQKLFTIFGWGKTANFEPSDVLQKAFIPFIEHQLCVKKFENHAAFPIYQAYLCAGGQNHTDSCQGDNGGGITALATQNGRSKETLYGISSFGTGCGTKVPSIYTNIRYYLDWILNNMS